LSWTYLHLTGNHRILTDEGMTAYTVASDDGAQRNQRATLKSRMKGKWIMNEITKMAVSAVGMSVVWVFMLMAIIYSATIRPGTGLIWILKFIVLLTMTAGLIVWWMRYLRACVGNESD